MPTAELISPEEVSVTADTAAIEDVDALLSQADSLMDEVQTNMGGQPPADAVKQADNSGAVPETAEETPAIQPAEIVADTTPPAPAVEAVGAAEPADTVVDAATPAEASESAPASTTTTKPTPKPTGGPQSAPKDWLDEAADADDQLPVIPDDEVAAAQPAATAASTAAVAKKRLENGMTLCLRRLVHLPLDFLILLDRPFARMAPGTKTLIGYVAIGTLVIATVTWAFGDLRYSH